MQAIMLEGPGRLRLVEADPPPPPGPGEALVRVHRVGICGTDLHAYRGRQPFFTYPRIVGHELGVEVLALGAGTGDSGLALGDRCSVEPYLSCGHCGACLRGKPNCCLNMRVLGVGVDGGLRELLLVPANKLHRSQSLSYDQLALVETLCIGAHAVARAQVERGEAVLIVGSGPIGLAAIQSARACGARVIVLEIADGRLDFCRRLGIERCVDGKLDPLPQLQAMLGGELPTAVVDATGNGASMARAFEYVAHGGRLVFVGLYQGDVTFSDPAFHRRELTLLASRSALAEDFARAIAFLEAGQIDLAPWVTHRATPETVAGEFPRWLEPASGLLKAVVDMGPGSGI